MRRNAAAVVAVAGLALVAAAAAPAQHGATSGHLLGMGAFGKVQLVGALRVHDAAPDIISDVGSLGNYAYLGHFAQGSCPGPEGGVVDGGVYVIDVSNPAVPREVGFIRAHQDTYVSEGVQALHIATRAFEGDVLVLNNEGCGKNYKAGFTLWNIDNPLKPVKLSENFGDFTGTVGAEDMLNRPHDANQIHSAFAWDAGDRAYLVVVDDEESKDVDIFEITDPRKPTLVRELDLNVFDIAQPLLFLDDSFLHDMIVKKIGHRFVMLLSYWDGGYVLLDVTDPRNPVFVGDTEFTNPDPQRAEHGESVKPEGNAHQAEFSADNAFFLGTDEDFDPFNLVDDRFTAGGTTYTGLEGAFTFPIYRLNRERTLRGPVVWTGGLGCSTAAIPRAPSPNAIALIQRGVCFFQVKADNALARGYAGFVVANDAARGDALVRMAPAIADSTSNIPGFFVGFTTGEALKSAGVGVPGVEIVAPGEFDAWGYVHLFDAKTLTELDTWAIREAQDPLFGRGFGDLSVHEVATDPAANLAYFSYYSGGFRVAKFSSRGITEVGGYVDPRGNDFWGVQVHVTPRGEKLVLASDRDSGLWIFRVG